MKVSTIFEESSNGDMALKFNVDGVEKTIYTYVAADCTIVLHERNEIHSNNFIGFKEGIAIVNEWVKKIWANYRFVLKESQHSCLTKFSMSSQYKNDKLKSIFKLGKTKLINTNYNPSTQVITFFPRNKVIMYFKDFENLLHFQECMLKSMSLINETDSHVDNDLEDEI